MLRSSVEFPSKLERDYFSKAKRVIDYLCDLILKMGDNIPVAWKPNKSKKVEVFSIPEKDILFNAAYKQLLMNIYTNETKIARIRTEDLGYAWVYVQITKIETITKTGKRKRRREDDEDNNDTMADDETTASSS